MTYRVRNIVIAVVLAALAALMTSFYVTNYKRHVQQGEDPVEVWVAKSDIPAGTSGADAAKLLAKKQIEQRNRIAGAISEPSQVEKMLVSQPIYQGEQVTARRFSTVSQSGIHGKLKGNVRAFQVQGYGDQVLAGTLKTGDHVDLVGNFKVGIAGSDVYFARTVVRNIEVLKAPDVAPGAKLGGGSGLDSKYSVMLAVTDAQANKLWFTAANAEGNTRGGTSVLGWSLDLRAPIESTDSPETVETMRSILRDGLSQAKLRQLFGNPVGGDQQ
jgi:Flp pilus assembly protein CpaB